MHDISTSLILFNYSSFFQLWSLILGIAVSREFFKYDPLAWYSVKNGFLSVDIDLEKQATGDCHHRIR